MSSDISETLGLIMFSVLVVSALVETILSGIWNKTYFTTGIPIFVMHTPVELCHSNIPSVQQLEARFHSEWASSLVFKGTDLHTYAFREKYFEFRLFAYSPIMHGVLVFDSNNHEVIVKGFVNWSVLFFSLIWLGGFMLGSLLSFSPAAVMFILFFVLFIGLPCAIQYYRFSKVAEFAAETWSQKNIKDVIGA